MRLSTPLVAAFLCALKKTASDDGKTTTDPGFLEAKKRMAPAADAAVDARK